MRRFATDACPEYCCEDLWVRVRTCAAAVQSGPCAVPPLLEAYFRYSIRDQNGDAIPWVLGDLSTPSPTAAVFRFAGRCWVAQHPLEPGPLPPGAFHFDTRVVTLVEAGCDDPVCDESVLIPARICGASASEDVPGTIVYVCPAVAALGVFILPADPSVASCADAESFACYCVAENVEPLSYSEAIAGGYLVWTGPACSGEGEFSAGGCCQCAAIVNLSGGCAWSSAESQGEEFEDFGPCCCPRPARDENGSIPRGTINCTWRTIVNRTDPNRPFGTYIYTVTQNGTTRTITNNFDGVATTFTEDLPESVILPEYACGRNWWAGWARARTADNLYLGPGSFYPGVDGYSESVSCTTGAASFTRFAVLYEPDGVTSYGTIEWFASVAGSNAGGVSAAGCACDPGTPVPDPVGDVMDDPMGYLPG